MNNNNSIYREKWSNYVSIQNMLQINLYVTLCLSCYTCYMLYYQWVYHSSTVFDYAIMSHNLWLRMWLWIHFQSFDHFRFIKYLDMTETYFWELGSPRTWTYLSIYLHLLTQVLWKIFFKAWFGDFFFQFFSYIIFIGLSTQ